MILKIDPMQLPRILTLCSFVLVTSLIKAQETTLDIVQQQLDTYNEQDVDGFASLFAENAQVFMALNEADPTMNGREEIRARYGKMFAENPKNKSTLMGRMVQGNYVFDHELISGRKDTFKIMAIYEVKDGFIQRCWFIK